MSIGILAALLLQNPGPPPDLDDLVRPITAPIQDAGVYDLESQTLRAPALGGGTRDVIYDNTCFSGYFAALDGAWTLFDEGGIPSSTYPGNSQVLPGCSTAYTVDAIELAYCTDNEFPQVVMTFYSPHVQCAPAVLDQSPVGQFVLTGLPGAAVQGVQSCWTVTVELGPAAFLVPGDGDGDYPGSPLKFGFSIQFPTADLSTRGEGPILAGCWSGGREGGGTVWDVMGPDFAPAGNGFRTSTIPNLLFFGDGSWAACWETFVFWSLHLELHSDDACPPEPGTPYCFGKEEGVCPCANARFADTGCDNAALTGGLRLRALDFAPDGLGGGTVTLQGSNLPFFSAPAVVALRSTAPEDPPVPFGDGLRCVGLAGLTRVGATLGINGMMELALNHGAGPGTFHYQLWYRSLPAIYCTPAGFNLSNAYALTW